MENLGSMAILLAFAVGIYAVIASVIGQLKRKPFLVISGSRAIYAVWGLLTLASGILVYALVTSDFRFAYVWEHTNRTLPAIYKFSAWWGGQEGSLLLWSWILASYAAVVVVTNRRKHRNMMPYVIGVLGVVQVFFLILNNFVANPFKMLAQDKLILTLASIRDGNGLNPSLQYPAMAAHPPMLYLGYVGFAVPFAFAIGSLITRAPGEGWIYTTRRWTLVTWLFQGCGIMLGSVWAYHVLGWGGYWGWDAVENASLLPWISGTAFLHSVMMQEKKGMMKVWNVVLISATFWLSILGTFLTRSGVVQSVHAFARSEIGMFFAVFLAIAIAATVYLILDRLDYLKSESQLESVVSRESSFLFNNLLLLASCFAVLWGTLFPIISEAFTGEKISLDADWYNRLMVPIGLALLLLTGLGPLFSWRRTSIDSLRRNFQWPGVASLVLVGALFAAGIRHAYALISFGFCLFVALTVIIEFFKGGRAIALKQQMNLFRGMFELTHRNTRRYGGYLVHMGIVLMFVGFTGHAFNQSEVKELNIGDTMQVGRYHLKMLDRQHGDNPVYQFDRARLEVTKNGQSLGVLEPEKRFYTASRQGTSQIGIRQQINEDLYLNFGGMSDDNQRAVIQAYVFPLVTWIWIGTVVMVVGTLICLVPSKVKMQYARTEVVGVIQKHVPVQK